MSPWLPLASMSLGVGYLWWAALGGGLSIAILGGLAVLASILQAALVGQNDEDRP